jgi:hypothetical protein
MFKTLTPSQKIAHIAKFTRLLNQQERLNQFKAKETQRYLQEFKLYDATNIKAIQDGMSIVLKHLESVKNTSSQFYFRKGISNDPTRTKLVHLLNNFLQTYKESSNHKSANYKSIMKPFETQVKYELETVDDIQVLTYQLDQMEGTVKMLNDKLREKKNALAEKDKTIAYLIDQLMDLKSKQQPASSSWHTQLINLNPPVSSCSEQYHDKETKYIGPSSSVKSNKNNLFWEQPGNIQW